MPKTLVVLLSHVIAAALGHWLWSNRTMVASNIATGATALGTFVLEQLKWFETATPGGIKLHSQLCHYYSTVGTASILTLQESSSLLPIQPLLHLLLSGAALSLPLLGLGRALQAFAWTATIVSAPVTFPYVIMARLFSIHLGATHMTWLAMRGKAPLSFSSLLTETSIETTTGAAPAAAVKPVDGQTPPPPPPPPPAAAAAAPGEDDDAMNATSTSQLAVAALLFMPSILTLPTTAWYYGFVTLLHLFAWVPVELMMLGVAAWSGSDTSDGSGDSGLSELPIGAIVKKCFRGEVVGVERWQLLFPSSPVDATAVDSVTEQCGANCTHAHHHHHAHAE